MNRLLLALALAASSFGAQAVITAEVSIGTPVIDVLDLAPNDGVPAAFAEGGPVVDAFTQQLRRAPVDSFVEGRARIVRDASNAIAGVTSGPASTFVIVADRYAPSFTFTVTPRSRVTLSTEYELQTTIAGEAFNPDDPAHALASMELALVAINNLTFVDAVGGFDYDVIAVRTDGDTLESFADPSRDVAGRRNGVLSVSFDNPSDGDAVFAFRGEMVAFGVSPAAAPIPEPETYALMLVGLAAVAAAARRRR